jgi:hypothetical protein
MRLLGDKVLLVGLLPRRRTGETNQLGGAYSHGQICVARRGVPIYVERQFREDMYGQMLHLYANGGAAVRRTYRRDGFSAL